MNVNDPCSIERMADRMQIQDVMYRWCRAGDPLDSDGLVGADPFTCSRERAAMGIE